MNTTPVSELVVKAMQKGILLDAAIQRLGEDLEEVRALHKLITRYGTVEEALAIGCEAMAGKCRMIAAQKKQSFQQAVEEEHERLVRLLIGKG